MFHTHDNWYWERLADGSVRVTRRQHIVDGNGCHVFGVGEIEAEHVLDASSWVSVVAHCSKTGETTDVYYKVLAIHEGK